MKTKILHITHSNMRIIAKDAGMIAGVETERTNSIVVDEASDSVWKVGDDVDITADGDSTV